MLDNKVKGICMACYWVNMNRDVYDIYVFEQLCGNHCVNTICICIVKINSYEHDKVITINMRVYGIE